MHFARKFVKRPQVQESTAGVTYLSMRMHPKNCCIFPLKVATNLLSGTRKGTTGVQQSHSYGRCQGFMLTLQALAYIEGNNRTSSPIWNYATGTFPDILERVLKSIALSKINCGEVHTHASYKTTRTWENFNNRGTKMILLSDKL